MKCLKGRAIGGTPNQANKFCIYENAKQPLNMVAVYCASQTFLVICK